NIPTRSSRDGIFAQLLDQRRTTHLEKARGRCDHAVRFVHCLADEGLFDALEMGLEVGGGFTESSRFAARLPSRLRHLLPVLLWQVGKADFAGGMEDGEAFDQVRELADIA